MSTEYTAKASWLKNRLNEETFESTEEYLILRLYSHDVGFVEDKVEQLQVQRA